MRFALLLSIALAALGETASPEAEILRAQNLHRAGDLVAAEHLLLDVLRDVRTTPQWIGLAYADLGVICHDQGRTAEAERWHLKAKLLAPAGSLLQVQVLNNLSSLYLETGQYGKSERVLAELSRLTIPEGEMLVRTRNSMAALHMARGQDRQAEEGFINVLADYERMRRFRDAAVTLNNLGVLAMQRNDVPLALARLKRSYELWQQEMGGDHMTFVQTIANYGTILLKNKQPAEAQEHLARALAIAEKWQGAESPVTVHISGMYADALAATGRKKEAKSLRAQAARRGSALAPQTVDVLDLVARPNKVR